MVHRYQTFSRMNGVWLKIIIISVLCYCFEEVKPHWFKKSLSIKKMQKFDSRSDEEEGHIVFLISVCPLQICVEVFSADACNFRVVNEWIWKYWSMKVKKDVKVQSKVKVQSEVKVQSKQQ